MVVAQSGWRPGEAEARVHLNSAGQIGLLDSLKINYERASVDGRELNVYAIPEELYLLQTTGIGYEVLIEDLNSHYRGYWDHLVPPGYHSYEEIIALADSLATVFPSICKKLMYGTSLGGRQLAALKISDNVDEEETEPEILFDGGCHGDEIGGSENLIRFARDLCLGYGPDSIITALVNHREIWLYLMVNPDGRANMSRFNEAMVDINRDYGYMWDASGGSTAAFSQPETRALRDCLLEHRVSVYISYHSGIEQAAYPWAYRGEEPRDKVNLRRVAMAYSDSSLYPALPYGQSYTIMYQSNGMSIDYNYGTLGQACITMELSGNKQPPDPLVYYNLNYPAMLEMIRIAGCGVEGTVTDSVTGNPLDASVWVDGFFPVYTEPVAGDFHKILTPGTHTLKVTANGYSPKKGILFNVPQQGSAEVNILLSPDSGRYARRVSSCRIPGNNPADEGYTPGSLGTPDSIGYSLGKSGWIVMDLGDTVHNSVGNELTVYEAGLSGEGYDCFCANSPDGPWLGLGSGFGTTSFDLGSIPGARFLKILDDGGGAANVPDAGFDLDAVKIIPDPYTAAPVIISRPAVHVYPNPSDGNFSFAVTGKCETRLTIFDPAGRVILRTTPHNGIIRINLTGHSDGIYYASMVIDGFPVTVKLIKLN
jgi:succinylglutamate desuccinylase